VEARQRGSPHCAGPVTNSGPTASTTPGTTVTTDLLTPPAASRRVTAIEVQCHQGRRRRAGQVHHAQAGSCSGVIPGLIRPGFLIGVEVIAALPAGKACQGR
jgi:hypothetical protein